MDTIVFFYKKRGVDATEAEPVGLKTYLLIRVGLDVGREEWFGKKLGLEDSYFAEADGSGGDRRPVKGGRSTESRRTVEGGCPIESDCSTGSRFLADSSSSRGWILSHPLRALRQRRKNRLEAKREQELRAAREQERERRLAARARMLEEVEADISRLSAEVEELAGGREDCYYVYEDSLRKVLAGEAAASRDRRSDSFSEETAKHPASLQESAILPLLWQKHFQEEAFRGYAQRFWVDQLLPQAVQPHFVILGTAPCLFDVIEACARRMKSLRWILPEADCDEELLGFVEDFCTEYGLAIMLEPFQSQAALKRLRLVCGQPVNVLDFTGEAYMAVSDVPKGSVWLDMFSVEEKRRRIDARGAGITYVSLKEKWKTVQKRCICPIVP